MDNQERTPFGRRLCLAREAAGFTQEEAAKAVGIAQSTLAGAEIAGKRSGFTPQLAALYGVDPIELATGRKPGKATVLHAAQNQAQYGDARLPLSNEEWRFIEFLRKAKPEAREMLLRMANITKPRTKGKA